MYIEDLRAHYHVSQAEFKFVKTIEKQIRRVYKEAIEVVGSRSEGARISVATFRSECGQELDPETYFLWLQTLNDIIRSKDLSAGNVKDARNYLPKNAPHTIQNLLDPRNSWIHLDNDLDLVVQNKRNIDDRYDDYPYPQGSGLTIDVFVPGNENYIHLATAFDF